MRAEVIDPGKRTPELLTQRLVNLLRLLDREARETLNRECGLRIMDWRILASVAQAGRTTVRELAEKLFINRSEASRSAAVLVERGMLLREDDPDDGRSCFFLITPAGLAVYERVLPLRQEFMAHIIARYSQEDRDTFNRVLDDLTGFLEDMTGSDDG